MTAQQSAQQSVQGSVKSLVWLSVVGIGEEGFDVLLPEARSLCEGARHILGARRHIESLPKSLQACAEPWSSPFEENLTNLDALQKKVQAGSPPPVCVLATGDPFCYGVGTTLVRRYGREALRIVPWRSSVSLAAATMGWAHDSFQSVSLHGRPFGLLRRRLAPCARLLVLLSKASDAQRIAEMLCAENLASASMTLLNKLGGVEASVLRSTPKRLECDLAAAEGQPSALSIVALELPASPSAPSAAPSSAPLSLSASASAPAAVFGQRFALPDESFVHDGQLTKRHARALTLASLVPQRDALLWDLGAGAGSVALEWCWAGGRACAVERDSRRAVLMEKNRARFALEDRMEIVCDSAQNFVLRAAQSLKTESSVRPQAIFIGGGIDKALLEQLLQLLAANGRLVANAVSLAGEGVLSEAYRRHGGELVRIAVAQAQPLGETHAFSPQRDITQYVRRV